MKKTVKRTLSLILALVILGSTCCIAFAAESNTPKQVEANTEISPMGLGSVIATNATTIYGGSGALYVTLPKGNWWADIVAGIGYTDQNCVVSVTVQDPDGEVYRLGSIAGSGSRTGSIQLTYAPAGTYIFYFVSATTTPMEVVAYIYD